MRDKLPRCACIFVLEAEFGDQSAAVVGHHQIHAAQCRHQFGSGPSRQDRLRRLHQHNHYLRAIALRRRQPLGMRRQQRIEAAADHLDVCACPLRDPRSRIDAANDFFP